MFLQENKKLVCLNNIVSVKKVTDDTTGTDDVVDTDSDESKVNEDSLKESYKKMYDEWIKLCV